MTMQTERMTGDGPPRETVPSVPPPVAPPPMSSKQTDEGRGRRTLGRVGAAFRAGGWPFAVALLALLLLVGVVAASTGNSRADDAEAVAAAALDQARDAEDERREVGDQLAVASTSIEELQADVQQLEGRVERSKEQAAQAEVEARVKVEADFAETQAAMDSRAFELDQRSAGLDAREAVIAQTEQRIEQNSFGDGTWEVGVDIQPGKYKTAGSSDCYWKKLSASGDIIDNEIVHGPSTIVIESSVFTFSSNRCGTWQLVP